MNLSPTPLQQMLIDDLRLPFLKEYSRRIQNVYQEAISRSMNDDFVDEALKPYYFGQTRYALIQSLFLSVGRTCNHSTEVVPCEQNGFPIPRVTMGRFCFTTHWVHHADEMEAIHASLVRKQHSTINEEYIQLKLFDGTLDEAKLRNAERIYANILVGCRGNQNDFAAHGFLRIAVPYLKKEKGRDKLYYAANLNYFDILQQVNQKEHAVQQSIPIRNTAMPKLKGKVSNR